MILHGDRVFFRKYTSLVERSIGVLHPGFSVRSNVQCESIWYLICTNVPFPREEDVPQGSVLSCTLFIIAISDIRDNIPHGVSVTLYVGWQIHHAIFTSSSYLSTAERLLQTSINRICNWSSNHGFKMSGVKTVMVDFSRKRTHPNQIRHFLVDEPNRTEDSLKFLGLTFDKRLNWKLHIRNLWRNCLKAINMLKNIVHLESGADRFSMMTIYTL